MNAPYRVPLVMNPRRSGWAVDCESCGSQVRMGPNSAAAAKRVIAILGALCDDCRRTKGGVA